MLGNFSYEVATDTKIMSSAVFERRGRILLVRKQDGLLPVLPVLKEEYLSKLFSSRMDRYSFF